MAFFGKAFTFDGLPSEQFELMLYDIGGESPGDAALTSPTEIVDDVVSNRWRPLFYGIRRGKKLQFNMVFGVNQRRLDRHKYLDRYELSEVAAWLTGHEEYKELELEQEDMRHVFYRCMISEMTPVSYGNIPWAFRVTVTCDSAYAYLRETETAFTINGTAQISFDNKSSINGFFKPVIEFALTSGDGFSVENLTDRGRTLTFAELPGSVSRVRVDNERGIITNDQDLSIYDCCNLKWLRLKRGINVMNVVGNGVLKFICEFPIDVGG